MGQKIGKRKVLLKSRRAVGHTNASLGPSTPPVSAPKGRKIAPKAQKGAKKFSASKARCSKKLKLPPTPLGATQLAPQKPRIGIKRRHRPPTQRQLKAAGLPPPATIKPGSKAYKALEAKWDAKLAAAGFEDIETTKRPDGTFGRNNDYLTGSAIRGRVWSPERAQFYRLLQNYLTHYNFKRKIDRWIMNRLNDGGTYREILAECKSRFKLKRSLYWFYYYVQKLVESMLVWNCSSPEGMLNPANADSWATDALLKDLNGEGSWTEAPNGLKLDQGWWLDNMSAWWRENGGH